MFYQILNPERMNAYLLTVDVTGFEDSYRRRLENIFLKRFLKYSNEQFEEIKKTKGFYHGELFVADWYEYYINGFAACKPYLSADIVLSEVFATVYHYYTQFQKGADVAKVLSEDMIYLAEEYFSIFFRCTDFITQFSTDYQLVTFLSSPLLSDEDSAPDDFIEKLENKLVTDMKEDAVGERLELIKSLEQVTGVSEAEFLKYEEDIRQYCLEWYSYQQTLDYPARTVNAYTSFQNQCKRYLETNNCITFLIA